MWCRARDSAAVALCPCSHASCACASVRSIQDALIRVDASGQVCFKCDSVRLLRGRSRVTISETGTINLRDAPTASTKPSTSSCATALRTALPLRMITVLVIRCLFREHNQKRTLLRAQVLDRCSLVGLVLSCCLQEVLGPTAGGRHCGRGCFVQQRCTFLDNASPYCILLYKVALYQTRASSPVRATPIIAFEL